MLAHLCNYDSCCCSCSRRRFLENIISRGLQSLEEHVRTGDKLKAHLLNTEACEPCVIVVTWVKKSLEFAGFSRSFMEGGELLSCKMSHVTVTYSLYPLSPNSKLTQLINQSIKILFTWRSLSRGYAGASSTPKQDLVSLTPDSQLAITVIQRKSWHRKECRKSTPFHLSYQLSFIYMCHRIH